jgi:hypothetical protein
MAIDPNEDQVIQPGKTLQDEPVIFLNLHRAAGLQDVQTLGFSRSQFERFALPYLGDRPYTRPRPSDL